MNIILEDIAKIDIQSINFLDTKKNIIVDGNFTKIIYADTYVTLNGIYARFPLKPMNNETANKNNYFHFNPNISYNYSIIKNLADLESSIVEYYSREYGIQKKGVHILMNQLLTGKIKLYREGGGIGTGTGTGKLNNERQGEQDIIIKISGVWETNDEVGITYKFLEMNEM